MSFKDDLDLLLKVEKSVFIEALSELQKISETDFHIRPSSLVVCLDKYFAPNETDAIITFINSYVLTEKSSKDNREKSLKKNAFELFEKSNENEEKLNLLFDIVKTKYVYAVSKSVTLSFEGRKLLNEVSSIVDVRPIYDVRRSDILGYSIIPTISIAYYDNQLPYKRDLKSLNIAIDEDDVEKLIDCLGDIVRKIKTLKSKYGTKALVVNEEGFDRESST